MSGSPIQGQPQLKSVLQYPTGKRQVFTLCPLLPSLPPAEPLWKKEEVPQGFHFVPQRALLHKPGLSYFTVSAASLSREANANA